MANILIIEPDRLLAETYFRVLHQAGHQVAVAPGAQSGVLTADRFPADLVILELQLVEHSGIEFLYEFRSYPEWQDTPVVLHTQVPQAEFKDGWQLLQDQLGVRAYLYKPETNLHKLLSTVDEQLAVTA